MSIICSITSAISGTCHLFKASRPPSAKGEDEDDAQTEGPEGKFKKISHDIYYDLIFLIKKRPLLVKYITPADSAPLKVNTQGSRRPTATGSDISNDKNHGADSNITLIAEQIGRIPAEEENVSLDLLQIQNLKAPGYSL